MKIEVVNQSWQLPAANSWSSGCYGRRAVHVLAQSIPVPMVD